MANVHMDGRISGVARIRSLSVARWLCNCDVPDLELFPRRYAPVRTVKFRAGVAMTVSMFRHGQHRGSSGAGMLASLAPHVPRLRRAALAIERFGSKAVPCT